MRPLHFKRLAYMLDSNCLLSPKRLWGLLWKSNLKSIQGWNGLFQTIRVRDYVLFRLHSSSSRSMSFHWDSGTQHNTSSCCFCFLALAVVVVVVYLVIVVVICYCLWCCCCIFLHPTSPPRQLVVLFFSNFSISFLIIYLICSRFSTFVNFIKTS